MKKKPIKRITDKSKKPKDKKNDLHDIIKGQVNLYQFCNSLSSKVHALEMGLQKLHHETTSLKKDNEELKRILDMIGRKIIELRDRISSDDEPPNPIKSNQKPEPIKEIKKLPPLHDDVITRCQMCEKIYHIKSNTCPYCGFSPNKK